MSAKISIIIPCYNQGKLLNDALESVLKQTYSNWECIIINDGSTDKTDELAQEWCKKDKRFKYFFKENGGLSSARNLGIDKASGEFIQFLDSDDYLDETKLEVSIESARKEVKIIISNFEMFFKHPKNTSKPYCQINEIDINIENILYKWDDGFSIPIHCGFFHISLFSNFRFPETLRAKEDWIMWITFFKDNPKTNFIDLPLALYRNNPESMTMTKNMSDDYIEAYKLIKTIVSENQYQKLAVVLISRYYLKASYFIERFNSTKKSNSYRLGVLLKKTAKKIGLLKPFKYIFERFINL